VSTTRDTTVSSVLRVSDNATGSKRGPKAPRIGRDDLSFGKRLRTFREASGLSYAGLAAQSKMSAQAIAKYEANPSAEPGFFNGLALARTLGCSPWALGGEDHPARDMEIELDGERFAVFLDPLQSTHGLKQRELRSRIAEMLRDGGVKVAERASPSEFSRPRLRDGVEETGLHSIDLQRVAALEQTTREQAEETGRLHAQVAELSARLSPESAPKSGRRKARSA